MGIVSTARLIVAVAAVSAFAACGGRSDDRGAPSTGAQGDSAAAQPIAVTGCVEAAPGTKEYVLRNVRMAPASQQTPDTPSASGGIITEGAWAKLRFDERHRGLEEHAGRMVTVYGHITDTGRNTIGTSGPGAGPEDRDGRKDASRAAGTEHHSKRVAEEAGPIGQQSLANGTAPEITVDRVEPTGKPCGKW